MIQVSLYDKEGRELRLPPLSEWKLKRTGTVPCDSFEGTCPWDGGTDPRLETACRMTAEEDGKRRFTGVVDECRLTWDGRGGRLAVAGRGLAALLLDNEVTGQDYQAATLEDILRDYVRPLGIRAEGEDLPAVPGFSAAAGSSRWQVLESFARYHGGAEPRFDVYGGLWVGTGETGRTLTLDAKAGATAIAWQDKRYGVCSEVVVLDRGDLKPQRVVNEAFVSQGGQCCRVITMPGRSGYQAARYSGQYQLDKSWEQRSRLELTLPGRWYCEPGDRLKVYLERPSLQGGWKVLETETILDGSGCREKLTLGQG